MNKSIEVTAPTALRSDIIAAAVHLFSQNGYRGTTINEILEQAKTSKGGLYHHFESKEQILVAIHDDFIDYELSAGKAILAASGTADERLLGLIQTHMSSIVTHQQHMAVFLREERELSADTALPIRAKRRRYQLMVEEAIRSCVNDATFRSDIDVPLQARLLVGMMNSTVQWYRPGIDMEAIVASIVDSQVRGLRA